MITRLLFNTHTQKRDTMFFTFLFIITPFHWIRWLKFTFWTFNFYPFCQFNWKRKKKKKNKKNNGTICLHSTPLPCYLHIESISHLYLILFAHCLTCLTLFTCWEIIYEFETIETLFFGRVRPIHTKIKKEKQNVCPLVWLGCPFRAKDCINLCSLVGWLI